MSLEKVQVSYIVLIFSGFPETIFFSLSFMQVIISLTKSTVTLKLYLFFYAL
jgi:hypothetical protein